MRRRDFCKLVAAGAALTPPSALVLARTSKPDSISGGGISPAASSAENKLASVALPKVRVHSGRKGLVTAGNKPFIPFGAMYFRPNNGWTPRFWKEFNAAATRRDLFVLKAHNFNTVRLLLTSLSFYPRSGVLNPAAIEKFDQFLALAEEAGIHVQVCALTTWQGRPVNEIPAWQRTDVFADPRALEDQEQFWSLFADQYKGRSAILTYELANEPTIEWNTPAMQALWNKWNNKTTPIPPPQDNPGNAALLAFQLFREHVADEWTRRQVAAIKKADPDALVTVGLIQWSIPAIPNPPKFYSGFRPQRQAKFLYFIEIHFYPLAAGGYRYQSEAIKLANLAYLESVVREAALPGLPTVLAEFGWYGGGICPHYGPPRPATHTTAAGRLLWPRSSNFHTAGLWLVELGHVRYAVRRGRHPIQRVVYRGLQGKTLGEAVWGNRGPIPEKPLARAAWQNRSPSGFSVGCVPDQFGGGGKVSGGIPGRVQSRVFPYLSKFYPVLCLRRTVCVEGIFANWWSPVRRAL